MECFFVKLWTLNRFSTHTITYWDRYNIYTGIFMLRLKTAKICKHKCIAFGRTILAVEISLSGIFYYK